MRFFIARRLQFQSLLASSQSGLNSTQYFRLMALASCDLLLGLPLSLYFLIVASVDLLPFNWADVHYGFSDVEHISVSRFHEYWPRSALFSAFILSKWLFPVLAFVFFLFFGVAEDATAEYVRWFDAVKRRLGHRSSLRDTE